MLKIEVAEYLKEPISEALGKEVSAEFIVEHALMAPNNDYSEKMISEVVGEVDEHHQVWMVKVWQYNNPGLDGMYSYVLIGENIDDPSQSYILDNGSTLIDYNCMEY